MAAVTRLLMHETTKEYDAEAVAIVGPSSLKRARCVTSARTGRKSHMRSILTMAAMGFVLALALAACGETPGQRAVTGGAIGAGTGAVVGSTMGHPLAGAVVGGLGGAAVGAATTPEPRYNRYGYY